MFKKVMALLRDTQKKNNQEEAIPRESSSQQILTKLEIEFILTTLRECSFKGTQVVELYNTVLKLQQQHKNIVEK
jgi:hypothetical protein